MDHESDRIARARAIREQLPAAGLFAGHAWRISPEPFPLDAPLVAELHTLGRLLHQFNRALSLLYRRSLDGRSPEWVARWLDQGKPAELLAWRQERAFRGAWPRVIRPDLVLGEEGFAITELDAVPGGIGLTAWLNTAYSALGHTVVGDATGMIERFASIFGNAPHIHLIVSEESATYRPEMEWLSAQLNRLGHIARVQGTEPLDFADGDAVYRFFELFDLDQIPISRALFEAAAAQRIRLTPPPLPFFEEKLSFALLWNRRLRDFWRAELGQAFFDRLQRLIPYTWVLDPSPLPPHAVIPELQIAAWDELKSLSQKQRELILKISGFSSEAWGARSVHLGSDCSTTEWSAAVDRALERFPKSPHILQRYVRPRAVDIDWCDFEHHRLVPLRGRVRLCPYYFVDGEGDHARAHLGGVLATVCPADKKILHGMRDAVLAPCAPA